VAVVVGTPALFSSVPQRAENARRMGGNGIIGGVDCLESTNGCDRVSGHFGDGQPSESYDLIGRPVFPWRYQLSQW
jgi:hypothetical protein